MEAGEQATLLCSVPAKGPPRMDYGALLEKEKHSVARMAGMGRNYTQPPVELLPGQEKRISGL